MKNRQIFCSACDRQVRVLITEQPVYDGHAPVHEEELVCLEIGNKCTGNMCPLGAAEPAEMVRRIVRNGIPLETLNTVTSRCPGCGGETEFVLYGSGRATCTVCGITGSWKVDHVEPTA